eukprot:2615353-Rhodomonas_salina.1
MSFTLPSTISLNFSDSNPWSWYVSSASYSTPSVGLRGCALSEPPITGDRTFSFVTGRVGVLGACGSKIH